ncbi:MAG: PEGA domain-containing protein [Kangiellaceae bacterium]|nr:PEGA domain-containing protein [Kangiellaceae bacterium]
MRIFLKLFIIGLFLVFVVAAIAVGGELIQPTRTLQSSEISSGSLTVFIEPPGLEVFLDQSNIGKTPIHAVEVTPGTHSLRIKDTENEIHVRSGKSLRLSWFKGTFIEVKAPEKETIQKPEEGTAEKKPAEPTEEKTGYQPKYDPAYWPLKPSGPIK